MSSQSSVFVAIGGNIGSGKTTLTKKLAERLGWVPHFEAVQNNPYLHDFYQDMSRWSFPLQVYFLTHRFNTHKKIEKSNISEIQDRSIYEDAHVFARALFDQKMMSQRDYENYLALFYSMLPSLGAPDLMIFLKRSIPHLMDRIKLRNRDFEKNISIEYLTQLNNYYDEWFNGYDLGKFLLIDTDDLDFLASEKDFNTLVEKIEQCLKFKKSGIMGNKNYSVQQEIFPDSYWDRV